MVLFLYPIVINSVNCGKIKDDPFLDNFNKNVKCVECFCNMDISSVI